MTDKGNTGFSVLAITAIAFAALLTFSYINTAQSQQAPTPPRGPFMLATAGDDRLAVWRIDQASGRVSYCVRDTQSQDAKFIATRAPFCSAWSE